MRCRTLSLIFYKTVVVHLLKFWLNPLNEEGWDLIDLFVKNNSVDNLFNNESFVHSIQPIDT